MIQDFMAGSLLTVIKRVVLNSKRPERIENEKLIHITQHRTEKREEDRLGMGREGLALRGRPFVRKCASSPVACLLPLNHTCLEYFNICL